MKTLFCSLSGRLLTVFALAVLGGTQVASAASLTAYSYSAAGQTCATTGPTSDHTTLAPTAIAVAYPSGGCVAGILDPVRQDLPMGTATASSSAATSGTIVTSNSPYTVDSSSGSASAAFPTLNDIGHSSFLGGQDAATLKGTESISVLTDNFTFIKLSGSGIAEFDYHLSGTSTVNSSHGDVAAFLFYTEGVSAESLLYKSELAGVIGPSIYLIEPGTNGYIMQSGNSSDARVATISGGISTNGDFSIRVPMTWGQAFSMSFTLATWTSTGGTTSTLGTADSDYTFTLLGERAYTSGGTLITDAQILRASADLPEPATWLLLAGSLVPLLFRRRGSPGVK